MEHDNMGTKTTNSSTPTRPWVRFLLAVSLGVNLLIGGVIIGQFVRGAPAGTNRVPPEVRILREIGLGPFLSAFPRIERLELAGEFRRSVGTLRENREALADELSGILAAIRAEPYHHEDLQKVFAQQRDRMSERVAIGRGIVLTAIEAMTDSERAAFADRMQRSMEQAVRRVRENAVRR